MIIVDDKGNELLEIIRDNEEIVDERYKPITHCLAVVKLGDDYLMGWNKWRQDWEIFGGCREENETLKECINRECQEELGLVDVDFHYIGLMHYKMAPGYFNPEWHFEYGGLYGITLPAKYLEIIEKYRTDKEEVEKLAFYSEIKGKEKIAPIDEKLLEYWRRTDMAKNVIHIFGASGSGTSTLGKKISELWGYTWLDTDDYFWMPTNPPFTTPRDRAERVRLIKEDIASAENVVLTGSLSGWGDTLIPFLRW